ncbi:MAG: LysR family transcriptional regulator [Spirochaetes bacterium]|jgi:DNA-binding transcriptional LysR family regulator|nr:LysR family transcriptional regulator [Spirochaetota bacterium]
MKELNFDLKQLRSFLVVVEHRSFTRASRALRVGQATISNHVSALEETLGVELIRRSSREFALTPQGEIFKTFCERHFDEVGSLRKEISGAVAAGVTVIASSTIPSAYILPAAIASVVRGNPDVHYRLEVSDSREVVEMLKEGMAEIGVTGKSVRHPVLKYERIHQDEMVLIAPVTGHPDIMAVADIKKFPMVSREKGSGSRDACERALLERGVSVADLPVALECTTSEGVREAVAAGLGVGFISRLAVPAAMLSDKLKIVAIKGFTIRRDFFLAYQNGRTLSRPAALLADELRKISRKRD